MSHQDKEKGNFLSHFFKTGKGQYGEGDIFLGITVPVSRRIAVKYNDIILPDVTKLLKNKYHEVRLIALLILVHKYKKLSTVKNSKESSPRSDLGESKKQIFDFYLAHTKYINNWDLVDLSASYVVGEYLLSSHKSDLWLTLKKLAKSENLWERRIAIISTFAFIYKGESKWTFKIVKILMKDKHDLIHKACGWMLREVGKRVSENELTTFLDANYKQMPRTMLRYAIERLPEKTRLYYLHL